MQLAVVHPADWDDELVAHAAPKCTRLGKGEVVWIRRHAAAHEAACRSTNFRWSLSRSRIVLPSAGTASLGDCFMARVGTFWLVPGSELPEGTTLWSETAQGGIPAVTSGGSPGAGPPDVSFEVGCSLILESLA
jgi:hypothetical protein